MSHYKRRRCRRQVRCALCTPGRRGNSLASAPRRTLLSAQAERDARED